MKLGKDNEQLEIEVKSLINAFSSNVDKDEVDLIVEHLNSKHGIESAKIYSLFNNVNNVSKLEFEEIALFGQQLVVKLGMNQSEWMNEWFTDREQKEIGGYQFVGSSSTDIIDFPMTIHNVSDLGDGYYSLVLSRKELARLYKSGKLDYNANVQRGMKKVMRFGVEIEKPIIYQSKVAQISKEVLKGINKPTTITLNAHQMTALEGIELVYDDKKHTLLINEGTVLDIVDGTHRILGNYSAYNKESDIKGSLPVIISNKSDVEVKRYQVDLDKHTPLSRSRVEELDSKSYSNEVVNILKAEGQLKNRITSASDAKSSIKGSDFTTYKIINTQINNVFKLDSILDARKLAKAINEYLVYLFGIYKNYMVSDYSLLFDADVFEGHLHLIKLMKDNEIPFEKIEDIIDINEFHKSESKLSKIVSGKMKLNVKDRKALIKIFTDMYKKGVK
ncbi:hypothetical protein [Lysinibacillus sp. FSL K6-0102]|uniref:hypothetical protein n=1 Tax=Lysinibacillus sp. FSL K6-0102 TaxID=2975290 RepID=UPI0030F7F3FC